MNKIIFGLTLFGLLSIVSCQETPQSESYTVTNVDDNLILTINNHQEIKVQLCGVDIPKPQLSAARNLVLQELKTTDNIVTVVLKNDKAEIFLTDSSPEKMLSEELLVKGLGKLKQDDCPNQLSLETAENISKQNKIGVWKINH